MVSFYGVRRSLGKFINSPEPRAHSPEPTAHLLHSYPLSSSPLGWVSLNWSPISNLSFLHTVLGGWS